MLVADGMLSEGDRVGDTQAQKIFRAADYITGSDWNLNGHHVMAFAFAGTFGAGSKIIQLLGESLNDEATLPENFAITCLLITQNGQAWVMKTFEGSENIQLYPIGEPMKGQYALGSGGDYAWGAMKGGADALQAVKIATSLDAYSGGKIQMWRPGVTPSSKHGQEFTPDERKSAWIGG